MRRVITYLAALTFLLLILPTASRAEDYIEKYKEYVEDGKNAGVTEFLTGGDEDDDGKDELDSFMSALPEGVKELLPDVDVSDPSEAAQSLGSGYFISLISGVLVKAAAKITPAASTLAAFTVIIFILKTVSDGSALSKSAAGVLHAALCAAAAGGGILSFSVVTEYLTSLKTVASAAVPLIVAMLVSTGNVTSAGVSAAYVSGISDICERVYGEAVLPLVAASAALSFAASLAPFGERFSLSAFFRKAAVWITVAVSTVSSFIFGVQSILAGAADTAGLKTVRFAVSSFVPFVGGAVGDTVSVLAAGARSLKNVSGVIMLVVLFALLLYPLITLFAGKIVLAALSALSSVLGLSRSSKLFDDMSSVLSCLIALVFASACVFLVTVFAFISYGATL